MGKFSKLADYMEAYSKLKKSLFANVCTPDTLKCVSVEEYELYKNMFEFMEKGNELVIHQAETIEIINEKLDKLLVEKTEA